MYASDLDLTLVRYSVDELANAVACRQHRVFFSGCPVSDLGRRFLVVTFFSFAIQFPGTVRRIRHVKKVRLSLCTP